MSPVRFEDMIGVDLDPRRRPGTPRFRAPQRWPNARWPIPQQEGRPSVLRSGKPIPPVFSTALPLRGLSGAVRRLGYRYGDHRPIRWLLLLGGDRVESWGRRAPGVLLLGLPIAAAVVFGAASFRRQRLGERLGDQLRSRIRAFQAAQAGAGP